MNAVIYARYSSDSQREESIDGQIRDCMEFAKKKGLVVIDSYIDRALSAKTDNRPEFQRMVQDSSSQKFSVVIVWKLDRFSRNRLDASLYKEQLKKNGVKVVSAMEAIAEGASGVLLESLLEGVAEFYSIDLSEKVKRGQHENALKAKYNGGSILFGYAIDNEQYYKIDPVAAPIVVDMFDKYSNGYTIKQLLEYFKLMGVKNSRGTDFTLDGVKRLLKNRKYIGEYSYSQVVIPDGVPVIVTPELFEKVQRRLVKNKKAPARHKAKKDMYILTTKLHCGKCGTYMVGESGTSKNGRFYQYYKCSHVKQKKGCDKKTVRKDYIEGLVLENTIKMLFDDDYIDEIASAAYHHQEKESSVVPILKRQLAENEKGIANLISAIEQGIITPSTKERLESLEKNKVELEGSLAQQELTKPVLSQAHIKFWLMKLRELDMNDAFDMQLLVDNFINAIYLYDDKLIMVFNYKSGSATVSLSEINCSDIGCLSAPNQQPPNNSLLEI